MTDGAVCAGCDATRRQGARVLGLLTFDRHAQNASGGVENLVARVLAREPVLVLDS